MADLDQLSIRISANTSTAVRNINNLANALRDLQKAMGGVNPNAINNVTTAANNLRNATSGMKTSARQIQSVAENLENIGSQAQDVQQTANAEHQLAESAREAAGATREAAQSAGGQGSSGFQRFRNVLSSVGNGVKNTVSSLGKFGATVANSLSKIAPHAHKASNGMKKLNKTSKATALTSKGLAKELLRVSKMLKLMVTRMALRALIKDVGEGFKSLALHSAEFDASMSGLINGSKKLSYSFAAMVSPLINALAPAIQYVINLLIKLVNIINQVFSALSGKGTWNKAKDFTGSWADSIKDANKNAKELKKTVLGFDELNQLQDNSSSGGDTSGNIVDMFDTVPVESKWKDLAEKIKDYWLKFITPIKKAWANVGDYVKEAWLHAFESVKTLLGDILDDFLEVWNQPETQAMLENILKIVGNIGMFIGNLADSFDKAWNKADVGKRILEKIRDICAIIVDHVESITASWAEWAAEIDFTPLLEGIDGWLESLKKPIDALMGVFEDFNKDFLQPLATWAIEKGGPQLLEVFKDFNEAVDWDKLRERLDRVWKALEPFAETVGEGLIKFIGQVSEKLANFLNSDAWDSFIDTLVEWTEKIDADDIADGLWALAGGIGAIVAIKGIHSAATSISALAASFAPFLPLISAIAVITGLAASIRMLGNDIEKYKQKVGGGDKSLWEILFSTDQDVKDAKRDYAEEKSSNPYLNGTVSEDVKKAAEEQERRRAEHKERHRKDTEEFAANVKEIYDKIANYRDEDGKSLKDHLEESIKEMAVFAVRAVKQVTELKANITLKIGEIRNSIIAKMNEIKEDIAGVVAKVKSFFSKENWTLTGVAEGLKETFRSAARGIKSIWNDIADALNGRWSVGDFSFGINLPRFNTYATGGFVEDGLFMANHGELVGKFSNGKTAVANNEQITDGIARAVYSAITAANSGGSGSQYINNTIMLDGVAIARAVTKGQERLNRRYSPTTV